MNQGLDIYRSRADWQSLAFLWFHVPAIALLAWTNGTGAATYGLLGVGVAVIAQAVQRLAKGQLAGRVTLAVALMVQVSLGVAALEGHAWQVDLHMYYFAMLATLVAYSDWRVIIAATLTVAVQHLGLNFLASALIYPGGGSLGRVMIHAVILLIEAGVLMMICETLRRMVFELSDRIAASEAVATEARQANQAAETARNAEDALRRQAAHKEAEERDARDQAIQLIGSALTRLANRDLTHRISERLPDAYQALKEDFNAAMDQLEGVIRAVSHSTQTIHSGTKEISIASDDLSRRTESQAASLEETAAAVAEITSKVQQAATGASEVRNAVATAREEAAKTGAIVQRAISSMNGIERSSQQITQIIGVIDEIAFQTNLLALNAGVEAARAGDAGRGFAVVAQEVRALAQRSAEAAKQIKTLISASQAEVGEGVSLVGEAGASLDRIVERVLAISTLVDTIATSAAEQASGLAEVNTAVDQMDQTTQQNAAMVEQTTAATKNLAQQSDELNDLIASFVTSSKALLARAQGEARTATRQSAA